MTLSDRKIFSDMKHRSLSATVSFLFQTLSAG